MAACGCPGCGGRAEWLEQQRLEMVAKRERFEAWRADPANAEAVARAEAKGRAEAEARKVEVPA